MKVIALLAPLALVSGVFASPSYGQYPKPPSDKCLSQSEAEDIVSKFITILSHPDPDAANATAQALLDESFTETSDSILSLSGQAPLGSTTFTSKAAYIASVLQAPGTQGITTIEILVAGCTKVLWFWNFLGVGSGQFEVKGFNLFTVTPALQVSEVVLEFNSIAWGEDTGFTVTPPSGPPPGRN